MAKIELITHEHNGIVISQRKKDGFIKATAMCQAFEREVSDWLRTATTFNLVTALARRLGMEPMEELSGESRKGSWKRKKHRKP